MPREQFQHVVEEPHPRLQISLSRAIQIQRNLHLGLARLTRNLRRSAIFVVTGFFHAMILGNRRRLQRLDPGQQGIVFIGGAHGYANFIG